MFTKTQQNTINKAIAILEDSFKSTGIVLDSAAMAAHYCRLQIAHKEHEVFAVAFVDTQMNLIAFEEMFRGTIDAASVFPREVAKRCLEVNAASVILTHNHPSGLAEPSASDKAITKRLQDALGLFDIRVLDHMVVTKTGYTSFAERGLL